MTCYEVLSVAGLIGTVVVTAVVGKFAIKSSRALENLTNQSLKIELFKQRFEIYKALKATTENIALGRDLERIKILESLSEIRDEVNFLFDKEIHDYLLNVISKYEGLRPYQEENLQKDESYYEIIKWFQLQLQGDLRGTFKDYLDLSNYGLKKKRISK